MSNYAAGHSAEGRAAEYLKANGYKILERNWRTRWCEIDIVAAKDSAVYFIEVKSRRSSDYGSGLDYITPAKLRQMTFAAEMWLSSNKWDGECQLAAIGIDGDELTFIDDL